MTGDAEFESMERQWEADLKRKQIRERLWDLHNDFVNLCAQDILTESEHNAFEDVLERVFERYNDTPGG